MPRPKEGPGFPESLDQGSRARAAMIEKARNALGKPPPEGETAAEPRLTGNGTRTASWLLVAGLTVASFGSAACTPGGATEAQPPSRTLPTSGAATVTPWKPDALPPGIPTPIPRNTPIPTPTQSPDLVKNCPVCPTGQVWAAPGKYCQDIKKSDVTGNPAFVDCSPSSNSCFPGYGCNPPEQRNVAPSLAQPKPPEAPKPAASERTLSKKPEELFRALLTTPFLKDELPQRLTARGISAVNLSPTIQALQATGEVNIVILDNNHPDLPGGISYIIFPDAAKARNGYNNLLVGVDNIQNITDFNLPAVVVVDLTFKTVMVTTCVVQFENVLVKSSLAVVTLGYDAVDGRVVPLAQAAINHLQRVGR